ncbi:4-(cytidine 5'-diphospho)-2-C-methyl-D-erythritol kinase [Pelistega ratti]|uniref:4-(cytidine 5'-diphospho)-2-C-methyl-D-erythritol kinase n=1 Tax=Pelistega ratti TaxID=2652177 RepID=UPI00135A29AC|nr:4-(cytidine 5'-diphospho)-2-C-methyl-D-erythritol kinase [Pelistega ratti]
MSPIHSITAQAPAKLNLFLHITGQRADGYHLLQSLFTLIDLEDTLTFTCTDDGRIYRINEIEGIPEEQDLVIRAAQLLQKTTCVTKGVGIQVLKRIPSGAGLGGGSSDAATTLKVLNQLWETGLSQEELIHLGVQLGADVPFFIFGQTAIAQGIGELLQSYPLKPIYYLILRPALSIPTAQIFKSPDLVRHSPHLSMSELVVLRESLEKGQYVARNDLEPVALAIFPSLRILIDALREAGFHFRMTGSGSCFFMPFLSKEAAEKAKQQIESWDNPSDLAIQALFVVKALG